MFKRNELLAKSTISALEKRNFCAYYCEDKKTACELICKLINKNDTISWGGSKTLDEIGIKDYLSDNNYKIIDRSKASNQEEKYDLLIKSLSCGTYLMSANAISEDGIIVNIDGTGNRVAALAFGPKQVLIIAGINKIVKSLDDAISRARNYAAPINAQRISKLYEMNTPCLYSGKCQNCKSATSICTNILVTRLSNPKGRIKVILVNDNLGF